MTVAGLVCRWLQACHVVCLFNLVQFLYVANGCVLQDNVKTLKSREGTNSQVAVLLTFVLQVGH